MAYRRSYDMFNTPSNHTVKRMENMVVGVGKLRNDRGRTPTHQRMDYLGVLVEPCPETGTFLILMTDGPDLADGRDTRLMPLPPEFKNEVVHLITDQKMIRPGVGGKETLRCVQNINKNMHYGSVYEARAGIVTLTRDLVFDEVEVNDEDEEFPFRFQDDLVGPVLLDQRAVDALRMYQADTGEIRCFVRSAFCRAPDPARAPGFLAMQFGERERGPFQNLHVPFAFEQFVERFRAAYPARQEPQDDTTDCSGSVTSVPVSADASGFASEATLTDF